MLYDSIPPNLVGREVDALLRSRLAHALAPLSFEALLSGGIGNYTEGSTERETVRPGRK